MYIEPYQFEELSFAWLNRIYFRFQTYRRKGIEQLKQLNCLTLAELCDPFNINLLEFASSDTDLRLLVSLKPDDAVSVVASKIKGRISKWINDQCSTGTPSKQLAKGYFAVTTGGSTAVDVSSYLDRQSTHHGYDCRVLPPVFVGDFSRRGDTEATLSTDHAVTFLRFHLVLSTKSRRGVFGSVAGQRLAEHWHACQTAERMMIDKVSFVPDHVHLAVRLHPVIAPGRIVLSLMNIAQELMWEQFSNEIIKAKISRLWQPGAYIGSFGDLNSVAVSAYVKCWDRKNAD